MIGSIEDSIIEHIHNVYASGAVGYTLKSIRSYGGDQNDAPKEWSKDFPAVTLIFLRSTYKNRAGNVANYDAHFILLSASRSYRNERAQRHGANGEVGASQILEDCASMLMNFSPDIEGVRRIEIGDIEPFYSDEKNKDRASVFGMKIVVPYSLGKQEFNIDANVPLETVHTNWDLPPIGSVGETLPDDENADATSHVTGD